jgi:hypothetical protein
VALVARAAADLINEGLDAVLTRRLISIFSEWKSRMSLASSLSSCLANPSLQRSMNRMGVLGVRERASCSQVLRWRSARPEPITNITSHSIASRYAELPVRVPEMSISIPAPSRRAELIEAAAQRHDETSAGHYSVVKLADHRVH